MTIQSPSDLQFRKATRLQKEAKRPSEVGGVRTIRPTHTAVDIDEPNLGHVIARFCFWSAITFYSQNSVGTKYYGAMFSFHSLSV
jgi:hypothetical protein